MGIIVVKLWKERSDDTAEQCELEDVGMNA